MLLLLLSVDMTIVQLECMSNISVAFLLVPVKKVTAAGFRFSLLAKKCQSPKN